MNAAWISEVPGNWGDYAQSFEMDSTPSGWVVLRDRLWQASTGRMQMPLRMEMATWSELELVTQELMRFGQELMAFGWSEVALNLEASQLREQAPLSAEPRHLH